jgi:glutamate carboxypeptidase
MDLDWIAQQQPIMEALLEQWVNINSYTSNLKGLQQMSSALSDAFAPLGATLKRISLPPRTLIDSTGQPIQKPLGKALHLTKHPKAPFRLFFGGHMDTVYPPDSPFQKAERPSPTLLRGPGAADMKGGLVILLTLLQALERSPLAGKIGWEVLINPDEEIGSVGSRDLLASCATRNNLGLLFEPAFADGKVVSSRKGSLSFAVVARGRAAHAGRDFASGRNAIAALARFILRAEALTRPEQGTTVNVGVISGGQAVNIIPDLAICRLNVRLLLPEQESAIREALQRYAQECSDREGLALTLFEEAATPPKPFDEKQLALMNLLKECGQELGHPIAWQPSGGACDGNRLLAHGLANLDSLGVIGGNLHTPEEYAYLPSLSERARLVALFINRLAT